MFDLLCWILGQRFSLPPGPTIYFTKKIVRIMTYSNYETHSRNIFIELNILALYQLIHNRIGFMMYTHVNGLLPEVMNKLYVTNNQYIIILLDNTTYFIPAKDVQTSMQKVSVISVHVFGMRYRQTLMWKY